MKFLISKELLQGKFYVRVMLKEFSEADQNKAKIFGMPTLLIRLEGRMANVSINSLHQLQPFGFKDSEEAETYANKLKLDIYTLKKQWDTLKDDWSTQEEI